MTVFYKGEYQDEPCVVKIHAGKKYFIWKFKALHSDMGAFIFTMNRTRRGQNITKGSQLKLLTDFMQEQGIDKITIEVLETNYNAKALLPIEQRWLNKCVGLKSCLNQSEIPVVTRWSKPDIETTNTTRVVYWQMQAQPDNTHAVVKLMVDDHYMIWKCKDLAVFSHQLTLSIDQALKKELKPTDPFYNMLVYIQKNEVVQGTIIVLHKTNDKDYLLKQEKKELQKNYRYSKCFNRSTKQHVPKWITEENNNAQSA